MDPVAAESLLAQVFTHLGLDRRRALRLPGRTNQVWRHGEMVVRACPLVDAPTSDVQESHHVLAQRGLVVGPLAPRTVVAGHAVTLYPWVEPAREASWGDVADALRRLWGTDPEPLGLAPNTLVFKVPGRLARLEDLGVDEQIRRALGEEYLRVLPRIQEALTEDPVVLHADARPSNLLVPAHGPPLWVDLDSMSTGPAPVDLVIAERTLDPESYVDFSARVGVDVRNWRHFQTVSDARALSNATWLATRLHVDPRAHVDLETYFRRFRAR